MTVTLPDPTTVRTRSALRAARAATAGEDAQRPLLDAARGAAVVHVVSGSYGAGHDAAAREIAIRLTEAGHRVQRWDIVDLFPLWVGRILRAAYLKQLAVTPESWELLLRRLAPGGPLHRPVTWALSMTRGRLLRNVGDGDLVISTHPFASQSLGRLRRQGRLRAPVATYLTDLSVHPLWVHRDVDVHLALHDIAAGQARQWGARRTQVIHALVPYVDGARVAPAGTRETLRAEWGLAPDATVALIVGGSLGIGELHAAARDVVASGLATPVVVCGHNEGLRHKLEHEPGVVALGWRDDLPRLLRASDCVIQNAGGFTTHEALDAHTPVLSYRCIPGHGRTNAAALEEAGLVPWARDEEHLRTLLQVALTHGFRPAACRGTSLMEALTGVEAVALASA